MDSDKIIRKELLSLLGGGEAHMGFDDAVSGFPMKDINNNVPNGSYTVWHLLEHMRIAQWDILDFVRNPDHVSPEFPDGYWPGADEKATPAKWKKTVEGIRADLKALEAIVKDPKTDFFGPIPHAKGYTVFREMLLVADHNSFHVGEFVSLRRALNMKPVKEY
ncbi:MAG: DinB family protein [Nitrospirota bacterium]